MGVDPNSVGSSGSEYETQYWGNIPLLFAGLPLGAAGEAASSALDASAEGLDAIFEARSYVPEDAALTAGTASAEQESLITQAIQDVDNALQASASTIKSR